MPTPRRASRPTGNQQDSTQRSFVVLDTSAIMADPLAHLAYPNCDIVVPLTVISELDNHKNRSDADGRNAREFVRQIERHRLQQGGDITMPVPVGDNSTLRIEPNGIYLDCLIEHHLDVNEADHRIIGAAYGLQKKECRPVQVVSNDGTFRIKAATLGLDAVEHTPGRIGVFAPHHTGYTERALSGSATSLIAGATRPIKLSELSEYDRNLFEGVLENEFVIAQGAGVAMRRRGDTLVKVKVDKMSRHKCGLVPRNNEQGFALNLLSDPDVKMIALRGHAGTGKSLLAIAAGLHSVEDGTHDQLMILRPMISVGRQDIGFLPGDVQEKLAPWFEAVIDALVAMEKAKGRELTHKEARVRLDKLVEDEKVVLAPVTFMRGRTLHRTFVILDEGQNVSAGTVKTVISRLGDESRLVITGDDGQIDVPYSSALTCGLNVAVDSFAGTDVFGQVFFKKGERSRLADLAAERM